LPISQETTESNYPLYYDYYPFNSSEKDLGGGFTGGLELGIQNYTKSNFGYVVSIGYRYQYLHESYGYYGYPDVETKDEHYLNRFKLSVGIMFN